MITALCSGCQGNINLQLEKGYKIRLANRNEIVLCSGCAAELNDLLKMYLNTKKEMK